MKKFAGALILLIVGALLSCPKPTSSPSKAWVVSTLAGSSGTENPRLNFRDGAGASARFSNPFGVAVDAAGNVYVADTSNHRIRKITPKGLVSTLAGSDRAGDSVGAGAEAKFNNPMDLAVDAAGNLYVADTFNNKIRKFSLAGGSVSVSTLAGTGSAGSEDDTGTTAAQFNNPRGVAVDASGNVYVADEGSSLIRKIVPTEGGGVRVSTLAGSTAGNTDGAGTTAAKFRNPYGVAVDAAGNVYVADYNNHRIRRITPGGLVSTIAGDGESGFKDGAGATARFNRPAGVAVDAEGNLYVADKDNARIRKIEYKLP